VRAQAVALTAIALALINVGLASLIAGLAGVHVLGGPGVAVALLALGVLLAVGAVIAWRRFLARGRAVA